MDRIEYETAWRARNEGLIRKELLERLLEVSERRQLNGAYIAKIIKKQEQEIEGLNSKIKKYLIDNKVQGLEIFEFTSGETFGT